MRSTVYDGKLGHMVLPLPDSITCRAHPTDTMRQLYSEAVTKAKQSRVDHRAMRNQRKQRQAHERSFAQAFVRQTNMLSRHVGDGERTVVKTLAAVRRADATAERRAEDAQVCVWGVAIQMSD